MRYETVFELGETKAVLTLEDAYEAVEVWVNGEYAGMKIAPPYRFDLSGIVRNDKNDLRIEVTTPSTGKYQHEV